MTYPLYQNISTTAQVPAQVPQPVLARTALALLLALIAFPLPSLDITQAATPGIHRESRSESDALSTRHGIAPEIGRVTFGTNITRALVLGRILRCDLLPLALAFAESQLAHPTVIARLRNSYVDFAPGNGNGMVLVPNGSRLVPVTDAQGRMTWIPIPNSQQESA
jgi:hypothetical protein